MNGTTHQQTERLLKLPDVIGDKKRGISGYIPMSRTKWYEGVKKRIFPSPVRIGSGSFWKLSEIKRLIDQAL